MFIVKRKYLQQLRTKQISLRIRAFLLVWMMRLGLWILPFPWMQRILFGLSSQQNQASDAYRPSLAEIARVVPAVSRYIPRATCLPQALAAHILLKQHGYAATVRIGVKHGSAGNLIAHAWVESGDDIVVGGTRADIAAFTPLPELKRI